MKDYSNHKQSKKKILLIMPYGSVGGMERLALSFYNYYKKEGYFVKALKFIKLENDIINFEYDELHLSSHDFSMMSGFKRMKFYLKAPFVINRIIKKNQITHSIAFGDMANLFSSLSFSKEFKIGSIHSLKSLEFHNKTLFNRIIQLGFKTSYVYFDKLISISKAIKKDIIDNCAYKFNNIEIIYNPHDVKYIIQQSGELISDDFEKEVFSKKTILFLGRVSAEKAPWHLIKAFKLIHNQFPETNLVFIGDGDLHVIKYIKDLIKELNLSKNVYLLGRRSNPYKYLIKANLLALTSHFEGTPNVIVESMCLGTPVVSSCCTTGIIELMSLKPLPEIDSNIEVEAGIITPNLFRGKTGIPDSKTYTKEETLLANALENVLQSIKYKNKLMKHRSKLLHKFDLETVANQYLIKYSIKK